MSKNLSFITGLLRQLPMKAAKAIKGSSTAKFLNKPISFMEHGDRVDRSRVGYDSPSTSSSPSSKKRVPLRESEAYREIEKSSSSHIHAGVSRRQVSEWAQQMRASAKRQRDKK